MNYIRKWIEEVFPVTAQFSISLSKTTVDKLKKKNTPKTRKQVKMSDSKKSKSIFDEDAERKYDIEFTDELFEYKNGKTINPELLEQILECFDVFKTARMQGGYTHLSTMTPMQQIRRLARQKEFIPIKDIEWQHVINYFKTENNALERYYPLIMAKYELYSATCNVTCALLINDELYEFCRDKYSERENTNIAK